MKPTLSKYSKQLCFLARMGYGARALIYLGIGILGALSALKLSSMEGATDPVGMIKFFQSVPMSTFLLAVTALGLFGFTLWRWIQCFFDADQHGRDAKGYAIRGSLFLSGLSHAVLGWYAARLAFGIQATADSNTERKGTAWLLDLPMGQYLVMALGLGIAAYAFIQFYKAYSERFKKYMNVPRGNKAVIWISKIGLAARGVSFIIIGWFFIYAGYTHNENEVGGLSKMWSWLGDSNFGSLMILLMAIGLGSFALYSAFEARYRRIEI